MNKNNKILLEIHLRSQLEKSSSYLELLKDHKDQEYSLIYRH